MRPGRPEEADARGRAPPRPRLPGGAARGGGWGCGGTHVSGAGGPGQAASQSRGPPLLPRPHEAGRLAREAQTKAGGERARGAGELGGNRPPERALLQSCVRPRRLPSAKASRPNPARPGRVRSGDTRGHGDAGAGAAEAVPAGEQSVGGAAARQASRAHTAPAPAWAWPRTPRPCPAPRGPAHAAEWSNQGSRQRLIHSRLNPRTGGRMRELADLFVQSFPPLLTHCFSKHVLKICCTLDPVLALDTQWIGKLTQTYPQG